MENTIVTTERTERHGRVMYFDIKPEGHRVWVDQIENDEPVIHTCGFNEPVTVSRIFVEALTRAVAVADEWTNPQAAATMHGRTDD